MELLPNYSPLSPKSYSKMPQVSVRDEVRGGGYTSSRRALLLSISHLNFWNRSDSSAITEKSMKSQETQFTRKSPWLTVKESKYGVLVLPLPWSGANRLTPGDSVSSSAKCGDFVSILVGSLLTKCAIAMLKLYGKLSADYEECL